MDDHFETYAVESEQIADFFKRSYWQLTREPMPTRLLAQEIERL